MRFVEAVPVVEVVLLSVRFLAQGWLLRVVLSLELLASLRSLGLLLLQGGTPQRLAGFCLKHLANCHQLLLQQLFLHPEVVFSEHLSV